jgi:uncharacterized protein (TIGR02246 family)
MKKLTIMLLIVTLITGITKAQNHIADEGAIKEVLAHFTSDWNKNDFTDMKDNLTADCNCVNVVGMRWNGLKEVEFSHQAFAKTMFKGVKIETLGTKIHFYPAR